VQKRELGSSGLFVSAMGLGCMGMSEFYGPSGEAEGIDIIHRAIELGITFLDTADIYGMGRNEELVGRDKGPPRSGRARNQARSFPSARWELHRRERLP
jgi:aryl-alcohol dehydrogenase-like predicted oxidoreductase